MEGLLLPFLPMATTIMPSCPTYPLPKMKERTNISTALSFKELLQFEFI